MNTHAKHIIISSDVPIFDTGPEPLRWYALSTDEPRKERHKKEDEQMDDRWKLFHFEHSFRGNNCKKNIQACPACFAKLSYIGYDD